MTLRLLVLFYISTCGLYCYAQVSTSYGIPRIRNFSTHDYGNVGQIWDIEYCSSGQLLMAADEGMLVYDGIYWNLFSGSHGSCRSLCCINDSLVYSGSDMDFGVWRRSANEKNWRYESLYPNKDAGSKGVNESFWGVYEMGDDVVFVSFDNIYLLKDGQQIKIKAPNKFYNSFTNRGKIYVTDEKDGLLEFDGMNFHSVISSERLGGIEVCDFIGAAERYQLATRSSGIVGIGDHQVLSAGYDEVSAELQRSKLLSVLAVDSSILVWGTLLDGVFLTDVEGNIRQHINKRKGLGCNTVLGLGYHPKGQVWIATDVGLSVVYLKDDDQYFEDAQGHLGKVQTAVLDKDKFYIGTNQGLYVTEQPWQSKPTEGPNYQRISGTSGQVWDLEKVGSTLFCAHDRGLFEIEGTDAKLVYDVPNALTVTKGPNESTLFVGTYNGVYIVQKRLGIWKSVEKMETISGAVDKIYYHPSGKTWFNIPNYGLLYSEVDDYFSLKNHSLLYAGDAEGPHMSISERDDIFYIGIRDSCYRFDERSLKLVPVDGRELCLPQSNTGCIILDSARILCPNNEGYTISKNRTSYIDRTLPSPKVKEVNVLYKNQKRYLDNTLLKPSRTHHSVQLEIAVPWMNPDGFQYRTENETGWSPWQKHGSIELEELPRGKHVVWARYCQGAICSMEYELEFYVEPVRQSWFWLIIGGLMLLGGSVYIYFRSRIQELKTSLNIKRGDHSSVSVYQSDIEQEVQGMNVEDLEKQLKNKSYKLILKARDLEEKNRLIQTLRRKVAKLQTKSKITKLEWDDLNRILGEDTPIKDNTLAVQLDELNQAFVARLKQEFTELTSYDLRLCTYIKLGMNSQEIAHILNVLPSSINVSRSRLRKKLGLSTKDSLYNFLLQYND